MHPAPFLADAAEKKKARETHRRAFSSPSFVSLSSFVLPWIMIHHQRCDILHSALSIVDKPNLKHARTSVALPSPRREIHHAGNTHVSATGRENDLSSRSVFFFSFFSILMPRGIIDSGRRPCLPRWKPEAGAAIVAFVAVRENPLDDTRGVQFVRNWASITHHRNISREKTDPITGERSSWNTHASFKLGSASGGLFESIDRTSMKYHYRSENIIIPRWNLTSMELPFPRTLFPWSVIARLVSPLIGFLHSFLVTFNSDVAETELLPARFRQQFHKKKKTKKKNKKCPFRQIECKLHFHHFYK